MFCINCENVKAEAGCYLPGFEKRICLECYMGITGSVPLPSGASPRLGGTFADPERIARYQGEELSLSDSMEEVTKRTAIDIAGIGEFVGEKVGEFREKREAFWGKMPQPIQDARNLRNKIQDQAFDGARVLKDKVVDTANEIFKPFEDLF